MTRDRPTDDPPGAHSSERERPVEIPPPPADLHDRALEALRAGRFDLAEEALAQRELDLMTLVEDLRIYQAELEIQNQELRASRADLERAFARFATLFATSPVAELVVDGRGLVLEANLAAESLFDLRRRQLQQHFFARLVAEPDRGAAVAMFAIALEAGHAERREIGLRTTQGCEFIGDLHIARLPSEIGEGHQFVCAIVDQTEAVEQRRRLRDGAEALRRSRGELAERVKELACLYDILEYTTHVETPIEELLQRVAERLPGALRDPDLGAARIRIGDRVYGPAGFAETSAMHEVRFALPDGGEGRLQVVDDITGPPGSDTAFFPEELGLFDAVARHLSTFLKRRADKAALAESREHYRILAELSPEWEFWLGPDGRFLYVSPACEAICGYPAEAFLDDPGLMERILHPDDRALYSAHLAEVLETGARCHERDEARLEYRLLTRAGDLRWIEHLCGPVLGAGGRWWGRRGANRDITARKHAETEVVRIARLYATLSATNQAIVRCDSEAALLPEFCRIAVEEGGLAAAIVARRETPDQALRPMAFHGPSALVDWHERVLAGGDPVSDPGPPLGVALSLRIGAELVGTLTLYADEPDFFSSDVVQLLDEMAGDLAFSLDRFAQERARAVAEQTLLERERHLAAIFRVAPVGIGLIRERVIRQGNAYLAALLGRELGDIIGRNTRFLYPDQAEYERVGQTLQEQLTRAGTATTEFRLIRPDGQVLHGITGVTPLDPTDRAGDCVFVVLDITARRRDEEALRRSRWLMEQAERLANLGAWEIDVATRRLTPSVQWCRIHGTDATELNLDELIAVHGYPDDAAAIRAAMAAALAGAARYDIEHRIRRGDTGETRIIHAQGELERDAAGRPAKLFGAALDITERKRAEQALADSEERLRLTLEATSDGMCDWDIPGGGLKVNARFFAIRGFAPSEFEPTPASLVAALHPDERASVLRRLQRRLTSDEQFRIECRLRAKGGDWRWILGRGQVVARDGEGRALRVVGTLSDITARRVAEQRLREANRQLVEAQRLARLGHWEYEVASGRLSWSEQVFRLFGRDPRCDPPSLEAHRELFHPEDWPVFERCLSRALREGEPYDQMWRVLRPDGTLRYLSTTGRVIRDSRGRVTHLYGTTQDVTEAHCADEQIRQAARVFESTADGVIITDAAERILAVNRAFTAITGYSEAEALGKTPRLLKSGRHDRPFYEAMWAAIARAGSWRGEIWNRRKDGALLLGLMTISAIADDRDRVINYVAVFSDITHFTETQERLEYLSHHDALTDLPNRALFQNRLAQALDRCTRNQAWLAVLILDLDRFKLVNDSLGHAQGDEFLRRVAADLVGTMRPSDLLARASGDEFLVMLEGLNGPHEAAEIARDLLRLCARPRPLGDQTLAITASIGIGVFPVDGRDAATLLRHADTALTKAKAEGVDSYQFFEPALEEGAMERLRLEIGLRQALERGEFQLHYQPQVRLADGALVGAEALLRWSSPVLGPVPPNRFIPLAEEIGLINELGLWVLEEACRQLAAWDQAGLHLPRLAINLSIRQLEQGDLVARVGEILERTAIDPSRIELEVTESMLMRRTDLSVAILGRLRELGLRLVIDDFGTGYSSLAYLRRLPLQQLKIDKSFVDDILSDANCQAIAGAIVALGHSLDLEVVAEGVETAEQADYLRSADCDLAQGYHFARPMPPDELAARWLRESRGLA
ncbi:PAS domain S-box protein [Thioalkalicoccus limnaeus]|uniref:PAS domain S-box protein n=1 Tax=Thioalkalicoccus limnaeus TaxID=120681 RepID=A0ABV4BFT1_9GAMM